MKPKRKPRPRRPKKFSQTIYMALAIAIVCIVCISVVLSMFNTFWFTRERSISDARAVIRLVGLHLNHIVAQMTNAVSQIARDDRVVVYLARDTADKEAARYLAHAVSLLRGIRCIALISNDGSCRLITNGYTFKANAAIEVTDAAVVWLQEAYAMAEDGSVIHLAAYEPVYTASGTRCGTVIAFFNEASFERSIRDATPFDQSEIFILSQSGETLYPPGAFSVQALTGKTPESLLRDISTYGQGKDIGAGRLLFSQGHLNLVNIFSVMDTQIILNSVTDSIPGYAFVAMMISIIILLLANMLIKSTTRPLAYLSQSISDFRHGNMKVSFPPSSIQEIDVLSSELNRMAGTIDQLLEDNNKKQKSLYEKELQILWTQFNPHLLYNSMNTIIDTAQQGAIQKVLDITIALAKYFQLTLTPGEDLIAIKDEICHAENYLIIQKIRFEDLDYKLEVDDAILNHRIPKLILQPIIENSINHGIKGFVRNGMINVRGYMNTGYVTFEIKDNGRGMRREELDGVLAVHRHQNITSGIGLNNINQRLQHYFGKEGKISIESTFRKGTRVIIRFPTNPIDMI